MATMVEQEVEEYESDPEEAKRSLAMRRRKAASDDEEGEAETPRMNRRPEIHSDESDGQGGAAEYGDDDDEEEELDEDEEEEEEEEEQEKTYDEEEYEIDGEEGNEEGERDVGGGGDGVEGDKEVLATREVEGDGRRNVEEAVERPAVEEEEEEEEKKESEPFAVPTAGAFYMHDDRFKAKGNIRHSRRGGRKLWESKDDRKWGHDKFEEMTLQERHYEEGRRASRGRYRGRGKNRGPDPGPDRGFPRENRSKAFTSNNNQNQAPKGVRGRGPRRYEPSFKNNSQAPPSQNKQSRKPLEKTLHINSGRAFTPAKNAESDSHSTAKQVFASSLSSASPPFYPSGSSNKDITLTQKRDVHGGGTSRNLRPSAMDENYSVPQANSVLRGKNIVDSIGMDKLYIDDSGTSAAGKPMTNFQMPSSGSSLGNSTQGAQSRPQGRGVAIRGQMAYQPTPPHNQVNRLSPPTQLHAVQRSPVQSRVQSSVQAPTQQLGQRSGSGSQASSPPKTALSINSYEPGEVESPSESTKAKGALVGKGKGSVGRGSFIYSGTQVMAATGNMAVSHGDQNFPAFLPVMQFGGQHPGGIGVPAVGMAFPGYVAQPQLGLGNSEMTWLPVLAGAAGALGAGALGATYCSPYIAVDGTYHARPPGQTSSMGSSSKENNTNKPNNEWKPSQRPELVSDEFGQRQNKQPRRYSEMNFGQ